MKIKGQKSLTFLRDIAYCLLFLRGVTSRDTFRIFMLSPAFLFNKIFGRCKHDHFFTFLRKRGGITYLIWRADYMMILRAQYPADFHMVSPRFEPLVRKYFKPRAGDIVVDVGSYIGAYTLMAAKRVGEKGVVVAIEPDPENFRQLLLNIKLNRVRNVVPIRAAAADVDGATTFFVSKEKTLSSIIRKPEEIEDTTVVRSVKLDTITDEFKLKRIDWLKIDVEGAEASVLRGAIKALERTKRLIIEVWPTNRSEIFRILASYGFKTKFEIGTKYSDIVNLIAEKENVSYEL